MDIKASFSEGELFALRQLTVLLTTAHSLTIQPLKEEPLNQGGWNNVTNCIFIGNYAEQGGSAIYLGAANFMSISRCLFIGNDIVGSQADSSKINNNIFIFSGASWSSVHININVI